MMYVLAVLENQDGKYLVTQRALNKKWAAGQMGNALWRC